MSEGLRYNNQKLEGFNMKRLLNDLENTKLICVTGGIGVGKTLSVSTIANELKKELNADLFSNYKLANSNSINNLYLTHVKESNKYTIVCIDEFEHVLNNTYWGLRLLFEAMEDTNLIVIIEAFDLERLPEGIRKKIDIHLSVVREESETIRLKGVNIDFDKTLNILENSIYYDAREPAILSLNLF